MLISFYFLRIILRCRRGSVVSCVLVFNDCFANNFSCPISVFCPTSSFCSLSSVQVKSSALTPSLHLPSGLQHHSTCIQELRYNTLRVSTAQSTSVGGTRHTLHRYSLSVCPTASWLLQCTSVLGRKFEGCAAATELWALVMLTVGSIYLVIYLFISSFYSNHTIFRITAVVEAIRSANEMAKKKITHWKFKKKCINFKRSNL